MIKKQLTTGNRVYTETIYIRHKVVNIILYLPDHTRKLSSLKEFTINQLRVHCEQFRTRVKPNV